MGSSGVTIKYSCSWIDVEIKFEFRVIIKFTTIVRQNDWKQFMKNVGVIFFSRKLKTFSTSFCVLVFNKKININLEFLKSKFRKTFPFLLPSSVSIYAIDASGFNE